MLVRRESRVLVICRLVGEEKELLRKIHQIKKGRCLLIRLQYGGLEVQRNDHGVASSLCARDSGHILGQDENHYPT